jgi:hypothetical protein
MLTDLEAREALHVLVLHQLADAVPAGTLVLKGGVNLRLFFGSRRFSEDLDLDLGHGAHETFVSVVHATLTGAWLRSHLSATGIERLDYSGRPAKNTDTTVRFKLGVVNRGGIHLPARIEASLRGGPESDLAVREPANEVIARRYLTSADGALEICHYTRPAAVRQKIQALASRTMPQARDVFDLWVLTGGDAMTVDLAGLRRGLTTADLEEAGRRAWAIGYEQFRGQVVEFLADEDQRALDNVQEWERRQLFVAELIEAVLRIPA